MASNGAEDLQTEAFGSGLEVQARSAVIHVSNSCDSSSGVERRVTYTQGPHNHAVQVNARITQNQQLCVSGTPSQRAYHTVPAASPKVTRAEEVTCSHVRGNGVCHGNTPSVATSAIKNSRVSIAACQNSCRPAASNPSCRLSGRLDSLKLQPRLLGTRTLASQRGICSSSTSVPKAISQKRESTMPTGQSVPSSGNKVRPKSNRTTHLTTANVTLQSVQELSEPQSPIHSSLDTLHYYTGNKGAGQADRRHIHPKMPLQEQCQDLIQEHIRGQKVDSMVPVDCDLAEHPWKANGMYEGTKGVERAREEIFRVPLTAALQKLMASTSHLRKGSADGPTEPMGFDSHTLCGMESANTGKTKSSWPSVGRLPLAKPAPTCLANGDEKPCCFPDDAFSVHGIAARSVSCTPPSPHGALCTRMSRATANASIIPGDADSKGACLQQPSVCSVTNHILAINPTKESSPPLLETDLPPLEDHSTMGSVCLVQEIVALSLDDVDEEELPDELENHCSGDDDDGYGCSSINASFSANFLDISSNIEEPENPDLEDNVVEKPALVPSLFPLTPPTLYFATINERVEPLPEEQQMLLKWKMSSVTPNVVKHTIARSHFKVTKKSYDWLGCWGHHMKSAGFRTLREYQKLNHFPGSFQIGRKDRLWRNLSKMQVRFGKQEFSFFPRSFVLPQDIKLLRKAWDSSSNRQKWIVKPPASARGIGIQVIHKWSQLPNRRPLLVQKYLHKPYLISGNKFDLRIYVYVSSYDPLRIYIFKDGLVRFASCKYSSSMKSLSNKFMHLTNYSVNKKNSEYQSNSDDKACQGHKWALKALWHYLGTRGVNTIMIWEKIKDIVIKTIIAADPYVNTLVKMHVRSPYSCHELFGFDVMLDENLKPWLLEVNISPSLHSNSALDASIKGQMIRDLMNLAGFVLPQSEEVVPNRASSASSSTSSLCGGDRDRSRITGELLIDERVKRAHFLCQSQRCVNRDFFSSVLDILTPSDVRALTESEDELTRHGDFERVFPSATSSRYLRFFEQPRYLNILLSQWEEKYWNNRLKGIGLLRILCQQGVHLGFCSDSSQPWSLLSARSQKLDSYSNLSMKEEPTKSSVVVSQMQSPQPEDEDLQSGVSSPFTTGSSTPTACSSLSSESLHNRDFL